MTYGITGIKTGLVPGGPVPLRREIDEWWFSKDVNDVNQRSLFIYALQHFMSMAPNPDDPSDLSFFTIAGIHGKPLKPWDTNDEKGWWYCAHGVETFPTWHRPYLLLYEQRLYEIMLDLIKSGKVFNKDDTKAMEHAANTWRLPFWDWAMKKPDWDTANPDNPKNVGPGVGCNVPFLLTQRTVQVKTITGVASVPNPMCKYSLPPNDKFPDRKTFGAYGVDDKETPKQATKFFSQCIATSRHPSTYDPKDPKYKDCWINGDEQNWSAIKDKISNSEAYESNTLPEAVYRLYALAPKFPQFATEKWTEGDVAKFYGSLENIHGTVHDYIGGAGQMGEIDVAAFDPIFWMHHCHIDRLFAMWQELYDVEYSKWLDSSTAKQPLAPFHFDTKNGDYDSKNCSNLQDLGYSYPELQKWLDIYKTNGVFDQAKYQKSIRTTIELLYSSTGKVVLTLPKNHRIAAAHMSAMTPANLAIENFPSALVKLAAPEVQTEAAQLTATTAQAEATQVAPAAQETSVASVLSTFSQAVMSVLPTSGDSGFVDGPVNEWNELDYVVNVVYDPFALGGQPYTIRLFLGDTPQDRSFGFKTLDTEIGVVYNFSAPGNSRGDNEAGCENCKFKQEVGQMASGQIVLTDYLVENIAKQQALRGEPLTTLDRNAVPEYLRNNLHWRITDRYDNVVDKENMPSLKISVAVARVTHYREAARFSEFGDYEVLWRATEGRLAGANPGDLGFNV